MLSLILIWVWANSNVDNHALVASVEIMPTLVETDVLYDDLNDWSSLPAVQALRDAHKADIVVFMTRQYSYPTAAAKSKDGNFESAYAIVPSNLVTSANQVFAHEVNHIYGANHQVGLAYNNVAPYTHAKDFKTGAFLGIGGTWRYTTMYTTQGSPNIPYLSNPDVEYLNRSTGTHNTHNNARIVRESKAHIADHYNDLIPYGATIEITGHNKCQTTGTATAVVQCGTPPFSYLWSYSDNGIGYTILLGYPSSINTSVTPLYSTFAGTYGSRTYNLKVTDALGNITYASKTIEYFCPALNMELMSSTSEISRNLKIYPNPFTQGFNIDLNVEEEQMVEAVLMNAIGQEPVIIHNGKLPKGMHKIEYKNQNKLLQPGVYFLKITNGNAAESYKLLVN